MTALPTTLLLVDDDADILELLQQYLSRFSFEVHLARDAATMRTQLTRHRIDLVVLDVMLPGTDGFTLVHEIRAQSRLPVIMLTARTCPFDRVLGLENGADDYVTKPFEPRELVARIHSVLRRTRGDVVPAEALHSDIVCFDGWELHRQERTVTSPTGLTSALSNAEFRLLSAFLRAPQRLLSRDQLMEQARGRALEALDRSIDLLVSRLRHKLADRDAGTELIRTVRGAGYMFTARSIRSRTAWLT